MNGDDLKLQQQQGGGLQGGVSFPPTPESPMSQPDYSTLNGVEGQVLFPTTTTTTTTTDPGSNVQTGNYGNNSSALFGKLPW